MITEKKPVHEGKGFHQFKEKSTIEEILKTASTFEYTAFKFYTMLQNQVSKRLHPLLQELADEEKLHFDLFQNLGRIRQVQEHIAESIKTPPSDHRFSDYIHLPELSEFPDDQAILQYALGREQAAMEQYTTLAEETSPGPIHDLFRYLAHEELEHKKELEKRYYELIHSGGV